MNLTPMAFAALALLGGCASDRMTTAPAVASATLMSASGEQRGTARFVPTADGLRVTVAGIGMAPGVYAAHVHAVGRCDAPDFTTAGGHWNPEMREHGMQNPQGAHKGDMPNLTIGADGQGSMTYIIRGVTADGATNPLFDADGAAVIIHKGADDYRTDPTGNAGGRQACGVVTRG